MQMSKNVNNDVSMKTHCCSRSQKRGAWVLVPDSSILKTRAGRAGLKMAVLVEGELFF